MARIVKSLNVVLKVDDKVFDLAQGDEVPKDLPKKEVERLDNAGALEPVEASSEENQELFVVADASDEQIAAWVKDATMKDVLAAVGTDQAQRDRVLAAEQARGDDARQTLVDQLKPAA